MEEKPSQSARVELERASCPVPNRRLAQFHLKSEQISQKGGLDKDKGEKIIESNRKAIERFPGNALGRPMVAAFDLAGHGCAGKGLAIKSILRRPSIRRAAKSPRQASAVDQRTQSAFPLAQRDRVLPQPATSAVQRSYRGMDWWGGAGASDLLAKAADSAMPGRQEYLARTVRGHLRVASAI